MMADDGPRLDFVWWEAGSRDPVGIWWGQLAGSMHRWSPLLENLRKLPGRRKTEDALVELGYHLEIYFTRTYELRERAVGLVGRILGRDAGKAKNPTHRASVAASVPATLQGTLAPFFDLLSALDEDVGIRNEHTHNQFLNLSLMTESGIYDPADALLEEEGDPKPLRVFLRREISRVSKVYGDKVLRNYRLTRTLLESTQHFTIRPQSSS